MIWLISATQDRPEFTCSRIAEARELTRPWIWRTASVIWGCGMLADAAARVVMSYTLPISTVPALAGLLWPATFVLMQIVTNVYYHRAGLWQILGARWLRWGQAR